MSRAEASLFLPPCGCVRAGALGSYGNEFCFQGTRPPKPLAPTSTGVQPRRGPSSRRFGARSLLLREEGPPQAPGPHGGCPTGEE